MRIILKIIAAPFVVALSLLWAVLTFLFCWAEKLLQIASGLAMLLALVLFFTGQTTGGIVFAVIAFLISPFGIPLIAEAVIDVIGNINYSLKNFITS
jgi:hypothetical protein